ncbi:MAG: GNAT family N-acetyltransferase [Deltaproteobacteria bacterium]|nr:GNAT family N-acetyltransferase [Deltaproteobacteria bacterium]
MVEAIEANLLAYFPEFRHLPNAEVHLGPDIFWALTDVPYPLYNSILDARIESGRTDTAIESAIIRGRSRKVPLLWWVGPRTRPADLGKSLEAHGFVPAGSAPGMAADLGALDETTTAPADLTIIEVRDADSLARWCALASVCFELPDFAAAAWCHWYESVGVQEKSPLTHYLGWQKGEPVAMGSMMLGAGVAGIYNVATLPSARRQGIGSAMTLTPLLAARAMGYRVGVLQSSEMGVGVYRNLGFREYCRLDHYLWSDENAG